MPASLREPKPPYDGREEDEREEDEKEEKTPAVPARRGVRCRVCLGTGRIHLLRPVRDVGRGRRCPACRGAGWLTEQQD